MSGVISCRHCGCSEIDSDPARGDAVCTGCGSVLEDSIIVSEVAFEEDGHGGSSAIGQFVSAESRGGGGISGAPSGFHTGIGKESREITLRSAKKKITEMAQQLRLNQHCIDVSFNFFKLALAKQLTKGRKNSLTIAACVYMTCRMERTSHLLIDFSDVVQMDVYALGRAFVQISRALCIQIPAIDPCLYILRFAHKFELGDKAHEVAMTASRLVQRMKKDWIHMGRRPSGLCGAALLIAARLHNFHRTIHDIISVVKVHETTLRKRLIEFGETPSSSLTLDEFMSVDLEQEHDPPSFRAARQKDKDRFNKLLDEEKVNEHFKQLQKKIEEELERRRKKTIRKKPEVVPQTINALTGSASGTGTNEADETKRFIMESTLSAINEMISTVDVGNNPGQQLLSAESQVRDIDRILMPPPPSSTASVEESDLKNSKELLQLNLGLSKAVDQGNRSMEKLELENLDGELDLRGIDDKEIEAYLMTEEEAKRKKDIWERLNADYIEQQKVKQEQMEREKIEGKPEKKKKKQTKPKPTFQAKSANEAIKIMLKERKMSNKINYDALRFLTYGADIPPDGAVPNNEDTSNVSTELVTVIESGPVVPRKRKVTETEFEDASIKKVKNIKIKPESKATFLKPDQDASSKLETVVEEAKVSTEVVVESGPLEMDDYDHDDDNESDEGENELSARQLLTKFRGENDDGDDDYYD